MNNCPLCDRSSVMTCKCLLSDSRCAVGHQWHVCPVHKAVVIGEGNHFHGTHCSCGRSFDSYYAFRLWLEWHTSTRRVIDQLTPLSRYLTASLKNLPRTEPHGIPFFAITSRVRQAAPGEPCQFTGEAQIAFNLYPSQTSAPAGEFARFNGHDHDAPDAMSGVNSQWLIESVDADWRNGSIMPGGWVSLECQVRTHGGYELGAELNGPIRAYRHYAAARDLDPAGKG